MNEIILSVALVLITAYAVYLSLKKREIWEDLQVEKVRREWDLAFFYFESHQQDFDELTKEHFLEDFPVLKKVFEKTTIEKIKDFLKNGSADILPYYDNVEKFKKEFLRK
jgi:hypothetical protein